MMYYESHCHSKLQERGYVLICVLCIFFFMKEGNIVYSVSSVQPKLSAAKR